jgi:two-component system response regulator YesN
MGFDCNTWAFQELLAKKWNFNVQCSPFQADILDGIIKDLENDIQPKCKKIINEETYFDAKQTSDDNEILNNFDVNNINKFKIKEFLMTGRAGQANIVMENIVDKLGERHFESLLLRHYVTMHIYIVCRTFADSIGLSKAEFEKFCGGPVVLSQNTKDVETTVSYLTGLLKQCIDMRCDIFSKTSGNVIKQAKEHIIKNYMDSTLSLTSVAKASCISTAYFSTIFKKKEGVAFTDYLNKIRIQKAKELLVLTLKNIFEIAFEVGFNDSKYFSQQFKKYYGMSPKEYRENKIKKYYGMSLREYRQNKKSQ